MEMRFVLRLAGATGVMATMVLTGCTALNRDPCDPRPPRLYSEDYYAMRANTPVGARQEYRYGKLWPPFPRPTGERQTCIQRYHTAKYWPYPYNCRDQQSMGEYVQTTVDNGWIQEATLYAYHFNEDTPELNHAGLMHLRWMLENAPEQHRVCWVQTGSNRQISDARLNAVQLTAAEMVGQENVPPVMLRVDSPTGRPAQHIDTQYRAFLKSMPEPRIHYEEVKSLSNVN